MTKSYRRLAHILVLCFSCETAEVFSLTTQLNRASTPLAASQSTKKTSEKSKSKGSTTRTINSRKSNQEATGASAKRELRPLVKIGKVHKGIEIPYSKTIQALKVYHENYGDLILPRRYVVPKLDDYPSELFEIDLAGTVYDMKWWQRHVKQRPDRVAELSSLGFVWERLQLEWNLVLEGLLTYGTIHGNLLVPSKFVIPHQSGWPKSTWGLALGNCVHRIRTRGEYLQGSNAWSRRDQLDAVGFIWCTSEYKFELFCRALQFYAQIEAKSSRYNTVSALKVPSQFIVPKGDLAWPKDLWGYRLGDKVTAVRQKNLYVKGHPERIKRLADLGFRLGGNDNLRWLKVVHASAVYSKLHNKKLDVPLLFVVPAPPKRVSDTNEISGHTVVGSDEAWPWPEYLWGFPLGQRLKDIRLNGYYLRGKEADERRSQLNALGFVWSPKRGRRKKAM